MKVLVGEERVLIDQLFEDVIAYAALARRWADARFVERFGHAAGGAHVNVWPTRRFVSEVIALEQSGKDAGFFVARLPLADPHALGDGKLDADAGRGKEYQRFDPGHGR